MSKDIEKLKGKINQLVGEATGDRGQETQGAVQRAKGREPKSEAEFEEAKKAVKASHHDYGERIPPQDVPHHER
ncbi:MAG: hypothetical protein Q8K63_15710 [Acidimicrobiales bacterium]|nr:hypothetical protein [Acidimicrobiales bacterium]